MSVALTLLLLSPFIALLGAMIRAAILAWPVMLFIGALHSYVPAVPPLGWKPVFFIVAIAWLLFGNLDSEVRKVH